MAKKTVKKAAAKPAAKAATKKPVAKKTPEKTVAPTEPLIVASKVKAYIKASGKMTASDTIGAINAKVCAMLDEAMARTEANKRSTVKPQDV